MVDDLVNNDQWWPDCQSKGWKMRFVVFPKIHFVVAFVSFSNSNKRRLDHFSEYEWEWIYPCYCCWVTTTVTTTLISNQAQPVLLRLVIRDCILYFVVPPPPLTTPLFDGHCFSPTTTMFILRTGSNESRGSPFVCRRALAIPGLTSVSIFARYALIREHSPVLVTWGTWWIYISMQTCAAGWIDTDRRG